MTDPVEALGSLALWTGLIVGGLLLVRRWAQRNGRAVGGHAAVRVVARAPLTRGAAALVLEADGRRFLVGAAEQRITLLSELEPAPRGELDTTYGATPGTTTGQQVAKPDPRQHQMLPPNLTSAIAFATERRTSTPDRPWIGLLDRARARTVRTHVDRPFRAPGS